MKKLLSIVCASTIALTALTGCGGLKKTETKETSDIPTITWYLRFDEQKDQQEVFDKVNEIAEKNIGCHVDIKRMENSDYTQKLQLALAAGEQVDICHMAPRYGFYSQVAKGAFLPLDDYMDLFKETYKDIPEQFWDAARVNGKLYGIPNYQIVGRMNGFVCLKELTDKYNFDIDAVEKLEDMEPFFEAVKNGESSNIKCFANASGSYTWGMNHYIGFDTVGSERYPCAVRNDDTSLTVINQFDTEEFMNYCKLMYKWYNLGYIPAVGSMDNLPDVKQQGLVASWCDNIAPGYMPNFAKACGDRECVGKVIDPPFVNTANVIATMNCIGATSKYPEYAVKFINMMNQNVDDVYNIMCYGIEGKHFTKVSENRIEKIADSGYDPMVSWEFGNNFKAYLYGDQEDDVWEETAKVNESAVVSNLLGFSLDTEPIKNEIGACEAVLEEYLGTITTGAADPETKIPEFLAKLQAAGSDAVIAEAQRQIDEWKKVK